MSGKEVGTGGTPVSQRKREAQAERERAANNREALADERTRAADQREALAGEREHTADQREALADAREREADERERQADGREAELTERQREFDERKAQLDERARGLGLVVQDLQQNALATIERSRALLDLSARRINRQEAAVNREQARQERQQAELDRASAETERALADWLPDPDTLVRRIAGLRTQARAAINAIAVNEEELARLHEDLAARRPDRRAEYRRSADQEREQARKTREILRAFTD